MKSNKVMIGCGIAVIAVLVLAIAGVLILPSLIPDIPKNVGQIDEIKAFLVQPVSGSTLAVNTPVSVEANAVGLAEIQKLDLWVNNHLWETGASPSPAGKSMSGSWLWTPDEAGEYTLMVRATDADGKAGNSNLIKIEIMEKDAMPTPDPQVLADMEAANVSTGAGTTFGEVPPPPLFPEEEAPETEEEVGGSNGIWIGIKGSLADMTDKLFKVVTPPKEPKIYGDMANPCEVTLTIEDKSDNETGFVINRVSPGSIMYKQIAKLDAHTGTGIFKYIDTGMGMGTYVYAVYAINSAGTTMGNLVTIHNSKVCQKDPKYPTLGLTGTMVNPDKPVTKMYCYMSTNGADWTRIPKDPQTFINGTFGEFDLEPYLGKPNGQTMILDCWGWNGDTLIHLGQIELTYDRIAPPTNLHIVNNPDECGKGMAGFLEKILNNMCSEAMKKGEMVVMWDWEPKPTTFCKAGDLECMKNTNYTAPEVDGFSVYVMYLNPNGVKIFTDTTSSTRLAFFKKPSQQGILQPKVYVRAFKGTTESEDSNYVFP